MNQGAVERLSRSKGEPGWMTAIRLRTLRLFEKIPADERSAVDNLDVDVPETDVVEANGGEWYCDGVDVVKYGFPSGFLDWLQTGVQV